MNRHAHAQRNSKRKLHLLYSHKYSTDMDIKTWRYRGLLTLNSYASVIISAFIKHLLQGNAHKHATSYH